MLAALVVALVSLLLWQRCSDDLAPGTQPAAPTTPPGDGAPTPTAAPHAGSHGETPRESPALPSDGATSTKGLQLRVRLRGLHPQAPWAAPLQLRLEARDDSRDQRSPVLAERVPDAQGLATFAVPDWCQTAPRQRCRLEANDANYRPLEFRSESPLDLGNELVLDVQVIAVIEGRVVDEQHEPVAAARVSAFVLRDPLSKASSLVQTNTHADGRFRLPAPPDTPLLLLVTPMLPMPAHVRPMARNGAEADRGQFRSDLLPASLEVTPVVGRATTTGDLVLRAATTIAGVVHWDDGAPIAGAVVRTLPKTGTRLQLDHGPYLQRAANGALVPGATTDTGHDGRFQLPGVPGTAVDVAVDLLHEARTVGSFQQVVMPGQPADFALPRPIRLRTTDGTAAIPQARIEIEGFEVVVADGDGIAAVVAPRALRVRAASARLRSPWLDVPTSAAGTTVDVVMTNERLPLAIEFEGDFRVRNTVVTWRRDDGLQGREHLLRDDRGGAFEVFLEPGRYHVTAGPGGGERNGVFLLPVERDVDVDGPTTLTLPALFGGGFTVMATDSSGVWVGGHCQLHDRSGADHTDHFEVDSGPQKRTGGLGELLADGVNRFTRILPPGDYELMCDFGPHGAHREIVKVLPREFTEVRIRLP